MATPPANRSFAVMGTTAQIRIVDGPPELLDRGQARIEALEQRWSRFLDDSELSHLNRSAGVPVVVSPETYQLVSHAIDAWRLTDGSFDPTLGATMEACGYGQPLTSIDRFAPVDAGRYRPAPGPDDVVLHPYASAVEVPAGTQLDLGGIAKGAAADLVAAELLADGAAGCLVNVGGDITVAGTPPRPEGWQITLDCPGGETTMQVGIRQGAICTSTRTQRTWGAPDTQRTWAAPDTQRTWGAPDRQPEHHLRDPRSGAPLYTGLASVTVIASKAVQGEVLTKAIFAAGPVQGRAIAERSQVTGVLVTDGGTVTAMPGLEPFLAAALDREPV